MATPRLVAAVVVAALAAPLSFITPAARAQSIGIWTSPDELAAKPTIGPAWEAVLESANEDTSSPEIADGFDPTNVRVLAAAIVYARTGNPLYRAKVVQAVETVVQAGYPGGETLAWARKTGAYALAADLVEYRTPAFETWLRDIAENWVGEDDRTLRQMFEERPNNWGSHAFGTLCAVYLYLGDDESLNAIREYWIQLVTGPSPPPVSYGDDITWHVDASNLRFINPVGAVKEGMLIDGVIPDDQRRGGSFLDPPGPTNYVWEAQQGAVMAARILERAELSIWHVGDQALRRALECYHVRFAAAYGPEWSAQGDDRWMLAFYDVAYGTDHAKEVDVWGAGKNTGWAYVLIDGNGDLPAGGSFADVNGDGQVNVDDLIAVFIDWGHSPQSPADLDGDGQVGTTDLLIVIQAMAQAS